MKIIKKLRKWQQDVLTSSQENKHLLIQAPGGAGKSLTQVMLAQLDLNDSGNKQLILVPKNVIHYGFIADEGIKFEALGSADKSVWRVDQNFCGESKDKLKRLKKFLLSNTDTGEDLTAIATHKAFVMVWKKLSKDEKHRALYQSSFTIDEAHHISNVFDDSDLVSFNRKDREQLLANGTGLGHFVNYALRVNNRTTKIRIATATFFRGDKQTILSKRVESDFPIYELTWEEHFPTLGIKSLTWDFVLFADNPIESVVGKIAEEPDEKHLVIIPASHCKWRERDSFQKLMLALQHEFPNKKILDLVSKKTQAENKEELMKRPDTFDIVVACRLFDEGTDWVPCTRMHNTDAGETSLTLAVQRFFRPLRKHPKKKSVKIFSYLKEFKTDDSIEEPRITLSNRFNAILACVITQGEIAPVLVETNPKNSDSGSASDSDSEPELGKPRKSLRKALGDSYDSTIDELIQRYECLEDKTDASAVERIVEEVVSKIGALEDVEPEDLKRALLAQVHRLATQGREFDPKKLRAHGIDAEAIRLQGFDKIWRKTTPQSCLSVFGSERISVEMIRELSSLVKDLPTLQEIDDAILEYHRVEGKRPTYHQTKWLNGIQRSASATDKILRRHHRTTLAKRVRKVIGDSNHDLINRSREAIRSYYDETGKRLKNRSRLIVPEFGISCTALNGRLNHQLNISLAQIANEVLGKRVPDLTLQSLKQLIAKYIRDGMHFPTKKGEIPELNTKGRNLNDRVKRKFNRLLSDIVAEVKAELNVSE
ncbi:DEAD/DEAH box helicase family protein [Mariniblastus sp.]|nr:DEAD/DEAH box helicase family protein [Mariniblastus sp.]